MAIQTDVLIVGAGPVGMTLALTLRKFDARVLLVDKSPTTTRAPRAAVVWPRTLEALDLLGIVTGWQAEGVPVEGFTLSIDGESADVSLEGLPEPFRHPLGIGQDRTEAFLDRALRASGADYRRGVELTELEIGDGGAKGKLEGEPVEAAWVVGCEGSRSIVREAAGIATSAVRNEGVQLFQADTLVRGSLAKRPGQAYLWAGEGGAAFVFPTHLDGHYRVLTAMPDDGGKGDPSLEAVQAAVRRFVPDLSLSDPLWVNRFRTSHGVAERYRAGRALLAGDSAHTWVPIGGQGMNIGMQDAHNLGWKLAEVVKGALPETVLDTYAAERRPIAEQNVEDTERMYHAILSPRGPLDRALRWALPHVLGLGPVSGRLAERFAEVDFEYPPSVTIGKGGGGRAPEGYVVRRADGETIRLFDLYRQGWTTLVFATDPNESAAASSSAQALGGLLVDATAEGLARSDLRDPSRNALRRFGLSGGAIVVVRPDGVVALKAGLHETEAARRLLPHDRPS